MDENVINNEIPENAQNNTPTEAVQPTDSETLLWELGKMRQELEDMRRELSAAQNAGQNAGQPLPNAAELSAGRLQGAGDSLYSPAEVRAMSRAEVRANLDRIRESMRHWN